MDSLTKKQWFDEHSPPLFLSVCSGVFECAVAKQFFITYHHRVAVKLCLFFFYDGYVLKRRLLFSHTTSMALGMAMLFCWLVGRSSSLIQTEIYEQLLNWLPWNLPWSKSIYGVDVFPEKSVPSIIYSTSIVKPVPLSSLFHPDWCSMWGATCVHVSTGQTFFVASSRWSSSITFPPSATLCVV